MNSTRNGKIARLPRGVRQELNRRLHEGEQGKRLVAWLNALPEVQPELDDAELELIRANAEKELERRRKSRLVVPVKTVEGS